MAAERRFRAMGSDAHVIIVGGPSGLIDTAVRRIDDLEQRWSRFIPESEVSKLNRRAGEFVTVSADTIELVTRAVDAWHLSGGAFDPTVLGDLLRAGYDRTFDLLPTDGPPTRSVLGRGADRIVVDGDQVKLPAGTGFDPGGIGKGLAADMVCDEVLAAGAEGACINLGGDIRVIGTPPDGAAWMVRVEHPREERPLVVLGLADGGVATSTTLLRQWAVGGQSRHHLIDPRTGRPSDGDVTLVTVVAAFAWVAEILAKVVLLAEPGQPFPLIEGTGAHAVAVTNRGHLRTTAGFSSFLAAA